MWDYSKSKTFARLLQPCSVEEFLDTYYERTPLHVPRGTEGYYDEFFGLSELQHVLYDVELQPQMLRVCKDGADLRRDQYCRKVQRVDAYTGQLNWTQVADPYKVSALFSQGCTIAFDDLRPFSAPVAKLVRELEVFFGHKLFAGMFLTPPHSQGFATHFDTVDSLILQVEGRKRWRVHAPDTVLPLDDEKFDKKRHTPGALQLDVELGPGDFLYLPRGTFHEAAANGDLHSLHLALGIVPIRWNAVIERALSKAARERIELRRSTAVPLDREAVAQIVEAALSAESVSEALAEMENEFAVRHRSNLDGQLEQILTAGTLSAASRVALRPQLLFEATELENRTRVRMFDTEINLPKSAARIVATLKEVESLAVSELAQDGEDVLPVLRRMIACGLVVA